MRAGGRPEAVPRFSTERNPQRETSGGRVANVSAKMGQPFMPWQRMVADIAHEIDPATGDPWYTEILIIILRQAGKTTLGRAEMVDRCLFHPVSTVRYTAQNRIMALQRLENDFWRPTSTSPLAAFLDHGVGRRAKKPGFNQKTGQEHIAFANGSKWWIDSVKSTSGHGPSLHKGMIDEAFAHPDARIEQAMVPAMATIADAQLFVMSAAGDHTSVYLRDKVEAARARVQLENAKPLHERRSRTAYIEYSAPLDADREDPATWWACHPALGHTITEAKISAALEQFASTPEEFDRAYLGWWPEKKAPDPVIPPLAWKSGDIPEDDIDWTGTPVWCIDVAPDRDHAAIGLAAAHGGRRVYVEVVDYHEGTSWTVRRLVQLREQLGGDIVAIDGTGAAGALVPALEEAGFIVERLSVRDKVDACGGFFDDAVIGRLGHPEDDPVLNTALFSAVKRSTDNAWTFWRGKSLHDISPLYAVVLARHLFIRLMGDDYDPLDSVR